MSQYPKQESRATSTGSRGQPSAEGAVKKLPLGLLEYLQQLPDLSSAVEEVLDNIKSLNDQVTEQKNAMDEMSQRYDEHMKKMTTDITHLKAGQEETRTILSKLKGMQMMDNNPNISDLSDQNRPTKLAERYGELYDNEWTDAYLTLTDTGMNNKTAIIILRDILTKTYEYCHNKCESNVERFKDAFTMMPKDHRIRGAPLLVDIPEEVMKAFKNYRKVNADVVVEISLHAFLDELRKCDSELAQKALSVENFLTSCFRLCWMMSIQDPPIYLDQDTSNRDPINKDKYRDYTVAGTIIEYIVWPCIYIEKGGAVLYKGVAQCYPKRIPRRPASAAPRLNTQSIETEEHTTADDCVHGKRGSRLEFF